VTHFEHTVPGGAAWSCTVRRDDRVTLTAVADRATVTMLVFNAHDTGERLNVPDTLKAQMSARIVAPMVLMSQRGRALASVYGSSLDWHDAITGYSHPKHVAVFGPSGYQADRNEWRRDAYSLLLGELWARGLDERDLHAPVNWFTKVTPREASLAFVADHAHAGDDVTLRAEQDLLLVCATAPHPLDPAWSPSGCAVTVDAYAWPDEHPSRSFRDESARALDAAGRIA
jgi:uncharacterized protein YcgI (DUF1989 family)